MSHLHRIQWFDEQIRAGKYPSSVQLAERFEISRRQAQRDIEYLASSLRAPLVYIAKQRGYGYEDDSFTLPPLYTTEEEKRVLRYLAYRYRQYDYEQGPLVRRIGDLLDRLVAEEPQERGWRIPVFEVDPRRMQRIELLERAIQEGLPVSATRTAAGRSETLLIRPLGLIPHLDDDELTYLRDGEARAETLSLSELREMHVVEEAAPDASSSTTVATVAAAAAMAPKSGLRPFVARIRLPEPLVGEHWCGYAARSVEGGWTEVQFVDAEAFYRQMLAAEWLDIERPRWLRERLAARCAAMLQALERQETGTGDGDDPS